MERKCLYCEIVFEPSKYTTNIKSQKFCSSSCRDKYRYHNDPERKEAVKRKVVEWQNENRDRYNERMRRWFKENADVQLPKSLATARIYQLRKRQRVPKWADRKAIEEFYKNCPKGYHVDHKIPLSGKYVSGLHCLDNLQYLPAKENLSKGNKFNQLLEI